MSGHPISTTATTLSPWQRTLNALARRSVRSQRILIVLASLILFYGTGFAVWRLIVSPLLAALAGGADMTRTARRPAFADLPAGTQAALLCKDARFQHFAAEQCGCDSPFTEYFTAAWLRDQCNILSRADLHSDAQASPGSTC